MKKLFVSILVAMLAIPSFAQYSSGGFTLSESTVYYGARVGLNLGWISGDVDGYGSKAGMNIDFRAVPAEQLDYPKGTFDVITACQCFWYFDHEKVMPVLADLLKPGGKIVILFMAWLPYEDKIAGESEKLVLKYNPVWSGGGCTRKPNWVPDCAYEYFEMEDHEEYDLMVPFTKESWHGRMFACRGVGASLSPEEIAKWDKEHRALLDAIAPDSFEVLHYAAVTVLRKKD